MIVQRVQKNSSKNKIPKLRFPGFSGEWEEKKLGEVANFLKGKGISKNDIVENGKNKCIRYGELYTEYKEIINEVKSRTNISKNNTVLSEENDLLIPSSGETPIDIATTSCIHQKGVFIGGDINILRLKNSCGDFFAYYLSNSKRRDIARLAQGHSVVHLYANHFKNLKINIPQKEEQEKIAGFLGGVDEWIENLKKQKEELEKYKKGIMQKIFSQEIRFKPARTTKLGGDNNGKNFPEWEEKRLGEVGEIKTGTTPPTRNQENYGEQYLWVTPTDIKEDKNIKNTAKKLSEAGLSNGRLILKNSLLVTCIASIGKNAILCSNGSCNQQINSITPNQKNNVDFLYYLIEKNNTKLLSYAGGGGMLILNKNDFSRIKFLFPSLPEQQKIADFLGSIDEMIQLKQDQITKAQTWKKGLMQELFV